MTLSLTAGCVTSRETLSGAGGSASGQRLYWKVFPKSDNTFYLIPRPELTQDLPTPEKMNSLPEQHARVLAEKLNAELRFEAKSEMEAGSQIFRVSPEPLLEDILALCKKGPIHPILENRCKKERAWEEKGQRPDIYLMLDACQAATLADALNDLYGKKRVPSALCPERDQVAK
jgi:hypothetical protein